mmetsp:Transcript_31365/g.47418  ORF Transcript_31365/g.47418 Transcript_31365/m.47418 type:complete len:333 (+) Transcript_31365:197-1195(+)|eukprot:CAMPEP_0178914698 /NCGR_PEP_ID=MMETSP0786-20121207/11584_1 /TAXON_ID=186022 /ORGANISM="Thalassionema frauenfeldii, Strain CCMP 1798" /LENGTH=332 /DNA_ID=CAMNT_0020587663 /DNA_START=163 /DNA_END=1161 /DNA_ORIENTATION=+
MDPEPVTVASQPLHNERDVIRSAGRQAISAFLDAHTCFSVIRASGKVVVFDTRIPIQLAFYALVEHDMQAAPLWDPALCQFVGLLTVTDFIDILRHYRANGLDVSTLGTRPIAETLNDPTLSGGVVKSFQSADTSTTLKQACLMLHKNSMDFLPIMFPEDMRVLATFTYTNILEHLVTHFREQRRLFDDTIYDLNIGTYHDKLVTVTPSQRLAETLDLLHKHNLSALPVVDPSTRQILGVYSRSDITFLATAADAENAIANLDMTLEQIMAQQRTDMTTPDALHTCSKGHSLQSIFEYFAQLRFNRLFVVDEKECLVGVVSARDLVAYFLDE